MTPIPSTYEILVSKVLNRPIGKQWTDWATQMLQAGYDKENLIILAGESEPYNQFYLRELTTKVLNELGIDFSDKEKAVKNYTCYLLKGFLNGTQDFRKTLTILKDLCIETDYERHLYKFYLFWFAKDDFDYFGDSQYHLDESVTKYSIDEFIIEYSKQWLVDNCFEATTA
jgi:hypothetical protein